MEPAINFTQPASLHKRKPSDPFVSSDQAVAIIASSDSDHEPDRTINDDGPSSSKKAKTTAAAQDELTTPRVDSTKIMVELDKTKGTLTLKQKAIELCEASNLVKKELVAATEQLELSTAQYLDLTSEQRSLVARLVHESDKTLVELACYVHSKLLPQTKLEEDETEQVFDPLPRKTIESAIQQVATRINYAPTQSDIDWLPSTLPKGFHIWRWEANDRPAIIPGELRDKYEKRWEERQMIKPQICEVLSGLNSSERESLIKKLTPAKRKPRGTLNTPSSAANVASKVNSSDISQIVLPSVTPDLIVSLDSSPACSGSVAKSKKSFQATAEDAKKASEKDLAKIQKEQKRREKEDAKHAAEEQKKKMGNLMSGWISKANPAPHGPTKANSTLQSSSVTRTIDVLDDPILLSPAQITQDLKSCEMSTEKSLSDNKQTSKSDYDRVFKPFNLKPNVHLAPVNRFRLYDTSSTSTYFHDLTHDITPQHYLNEFLQFGKSSSTRTSKSSVLTVREVVNRIAESEMSGSIDECKKWRRTLQNRSLVAVKVLRFHEDVRPGYIGTWSKTSRLVGARNPFGKDTCLLDYEYDSEADWVEEDGEGEDLAMSDNAQDEGDGGSSEAADSDEDGWLVGDDEDIEMVDDVDNHASNRQLDSELDNGGVAPEPSKKISGHGRRKIIAPLIPVVKGPMWEESLGTVHTSTFQALRIQFINDAHHGINPMTFVSKHCIKLPKPKVTNSITDICANVLPLPTHSNPITAKLIGLPLSDIKANNPVDLKPSSIGNLNKNTSSVTEPLKRNRPQSSFPDRLIPTLLSIVNGNRKAKPLLVEDLRIAFIDHHVSKKSIERILSDVAIKISGVWRVVDRANNPSNPSF